MSKHVDAGSQGIFLFPEQDRLISTVLGAKKIWAPEDWNFIKANLKEGSNCVNLGAHVGVFTCLMSQIVGENGHVWSFEPNPELVECLNDNVGRLGKGNVTVFPYAASNQNIDTTMFINTINTGDNRLFNFDLTGDEKYFDKEIEIKAVKVDDLIMDKKIDFVLSDCQGWDFFALEGMKDIIERDMPLVVVEVVPVWLKELGVDYAAIINDYEILGYSITCMQLPHIRSAKRIIEFLNSFIGEEHVDLILEKK